MFKSNKGFTLVELIVVIAILAILAGVAIPVYNGYIKRAQDAAVVTELDAIQTAAQAANATSGEVVKIIVDSTGVKVAGRDNKLASGFNGDFALFYPDAEGKYGEALGVFTVAVELKGSYTDGATWENGEWSKGVNGTIGDQTAGSSIGGVTPSNPNPPATDEEEEEEDPVTPCEHTYDNACDDSCNKCGDTRTVGDHTFDTNTHKCTICGAGDPAWSLPNT